MSNEFISISAPSAKSVAERYASASAAVNLEFKTTMDELGRLTVQVLKKNVNVDTGALRDSIKYELQSSGGGYRLTFKADAQAKSDGSYYVNYVDKGTKPHLIQVRNKRALHFFDRNGNEVFAQAVYHPGYKGSNFSGRTAQEIEGQLHSVTDRLMLRIVRRLTG